MGVYRGSELYSYALSKSRKILSAKKAKAGGIVATKALSNKVARASYYVMRDQVPFDEDKLFA